MRMMISQSSLLGVALSVIAVIAIPARESSLTQRDDISGELNMNIDLTLNDKIFPPKDTNIANFPNDLSAYCVGCTVHGDISFSGGGHDLGIDYDPDANFTKIPAPGFDDTENWIGIAMDDFTVHLEIAIDLTPSGDTNASELVVHMLPIPRKLHGLQIGDLLALDVFYDPEIHGWVNTSTAVNFTYGFNLTIPPGSALFIPLAHLDNIVAVGFNETKLVPTGLKSSTGDLEIALELSYRPVLGLDITIAGDTMSFNISADIPKLDMTISQVSNVDSACNAATSSSGNTYNNLTHIVPSISTDIFVDLDGDDHEPLAPSGIPLPTNCLQYDKKAKTLGPPAPTSGAVRGVLPASGAMVMALWGLVVIGG